MCGRESQHDAANSAAICLWAVTKECVHVRVDRVEECLLRDPVRRGVGHELARERQSMRVHSAALPLVDDLRPHGRNELDRDDARGEDIG